MCPQGKITQTHLQHHLCIWHRCRPLLPASRCGWLAEVELGQPEGVGVVLIRELVPSQWLVIAAGRGQLAACGGHEEEGSLTVEACSPTLRPNNPRNTHWKCWCAVFMNKSLGYFRCILHLNTCVSDGGLCRCSWQRWKKLYLGSISHFAAIRKQRSQKLFFSISEAMNISHVY